MLFENPVPLNMHLRITTHLGSVTVEKIAGIFTKRIWQHYLKITRKMRKRFLSATFQRWLTGTFSRYV